ITDLGATEAVIAGGTGAVKPAIEAALAALPGIETVTRLGGADRYATANAINAFAFADSDTAYVASGRDFPDALSAAAAAGGVGGPLLLSNGACTSTAALQQLVAHGTSSVYFVGGTGVLRSTVLEFMTCG